MLTVDRIFGLKLEILGRIIGWLNLIRSGLAIPLLIYLMVTDISQTSCEETYQMYKMLNLIRHSGLEDCRREYEELIIEYSIIVALLLLSFVIHFLLLRGISNNNHKKILPAVIFKVTTSIVILLYNISQLKNESLNERIVLVIIDFVIFMVLYSLYVKVKNGNTREAVKVQFNEKVQNI